LIETGSVIPSLFKLSVLWHLSGKVNTSFFSMYEGVLPRESLDPERETSKLSYFAFASRSRSRRLGQVPCRLLVPKALETPYSVPLRRDHVIREDLGCDGYWLCRVVAGRAQLPKSLRGMTSHLAIGQ
jgi:hypothetical protein